jgi:glutamate 5-kinase
MERKNFIQTYKRIVIKCGSAVVTNEAGMLDEDVINNLAADIARYFKDNYKITLVTSGAVASGIGVFKREPKNLKEKQAFSSVGQIYLMESYKKAFDRFNLKIAQLLLTHDDFKNRKRFLNIKENVETLINLGAVPIVNENDCVVINEIKFGDNDQLSALYAGLFNADLLLLLTDIDGFFTSNPKCMENSSCKLIQSVKEIDEKIYKLASTTKSKLGSGGMLSKLKAADKATSLGIPVIIANGKKKGIINSVLSGEITGTFFYPKKNKLKSKKYWILYTGKSKGDIILDKGAVDAITLKGKSLLPAGIVNVNGKFEEGDIVKCKDLNGNIIAKGITYYSSEDVLKIKQKDSSQIKEILGYKYADEIIHRNNLVIIKK